MDLRVELSGKSFLHELMKLDNPARYYAVISISAKQIGNFGYRETDHHLNQMLIPISEEQYNQLKELPENKRIGIAIGKLEITLK